MLSTKEVVRDRKAALYPKLTCIPNLLLIRLLILYFMTNSVIYLKCCLLDFF